MPGENLEGFQNLPGLGMGKNHDENKDLRKVKVKVNVKVRQRREAATLFLVRTFVKRMNENPKDFMAHRKERLC